MGFLPVLFQSNFLVSFFAPWNTMKFPGWEHGIPFKPIGLDNLNLLYPYKDLTMELFTRGIFPLWNPYNFSGNVLFADLASAVLYPLNVMFLLFGMTDGWTIMTIIQPFLFGYFTYLFLSSVGLKKGAAIFGAVAAAVSPSFLAWISDHLTVSHAFLWLPLILFSIEKFVQTGKRKFIALGAFALATSLLAGFMQPFAYVFGASVLYAGFRKRSVWLLTMFILGLGLSAIQILPTLELLALSPRVTADVGYLADMYLLPVRHLLSLITPDYQGSPASYNFFGIGGYAESVLSIGIVPLIFALASFWNIRKNRFIQFFWFLAFTTIILGLKLPGIPLVYRSGIPIISTFVPSRIFLLSAFALSILAGFGMQTVQDKKSVNHVLSVSLFITLLIVACRFLPIFTGFTIQQIELFHKQLMIPLALTAVLVVGLLAAHIGKRVHSLVPFGVIMLTLAFGAYFSFKYLSVSERQFVYPPHPVFTYLKENAGLNRFWSYGDAYIYGNFATQYRIYSPDGTDALLPSRLGELYNAAGNGGTWISSDRIDARIPQANEGDFMTDNPYRLRLLSLTGVKYITDYAKDAGKLLQEKKFPPDLFTEVWSEENWRIYTYNQTLPRVFLTNTYKVETDKQKILDTIYAEKSGSQKIVLEEPTSLPLQGQTLKGVAEIVSYEPNRVTVKVQTDNNALLYLSDTHFPGWNAFVDGKETNVYRANYTFRAVEVPAGAKIVEFRYEPASFFWGGVISAISLIILLFMLFFRHPGPRAGIHH